jgi:hypothetical protein
VCDHDIIMIHHGKTSHVDEELSVGKSNVAIPKLKLNNETKFENIKKIVGLIEERDKQTFNKMGDALIPLVLVIMGNDRASKPNALIELADHLTTFDTIECYKYAYFAYRESVSDCFKLNQENSEHNQENSEEVTWLLQDSLLGIARILKGKHLEDEISEPYKKGNEILKFLQSEFSNEEAELYL